MKKVSKIISMIMACALVMGLALTPALAAELTLDSFDSAGVLLAGADNYNYHVADGGIDLSSVGQITIQNNATIDTRGQTITTSNAIVVKDATLTLTSTGGEPGKVGGITSTNTTDAVTAPNGKQDVAAIVVQGKGNLTATGVKIEAKGSDTVKEKGIVNHGSGTVKLEDSTVNATDVGVLMRSGELKATGGTVDAGTYGVTVQGGTQANINGTEITSGSNSGILVADGNSNLRATGVTVSSDKYGIDVHNKATATINGESTINGKKGGILAYDEGSAVTATDVTVTSSDGYGLDVDHGATATVNGNSQITSKSTGILVDGTNSAVTAENVTVTSDTRGLGVQSGATATVSGKSTITGKAGVGVFANAGTTTILKGETTVKGNGNDGDVYLKQNNNIYPILDLTEIDSFNGTIVYYDESTKDGSTVKLPAGKVLVDIVDENGKVIGSQMVDAPSTGSQTPPPPSGSGQDDPADENTENTEIADERVPLAAGPVSGNELVDYLFNGDEDAMAAFITWAVEKGYIKSEADLEEIVTYGLLRTIMDAWCEYREIAVKFVCEGADDDIAVDAGALVEDFLKKVEE